MLRAAVSLDVGDPLDLVPPALREREEVVLSRIVFLRGKEWDTKWWEVARRAAGDFPKNDWFAFFASESVVDEATRDPTFRVMRRVAHDRREQLEDAARTLERQWDQVLKSEAPDREMGRSILADAMLARQVLGDFSIALDLAAQLIERSADANLLLNAVQVAQFSHRIDLALKGLTKIGDAPRARFLRAMIHLDRNELAQAAMCLVAAEVPEPERAIAATVTALASLETAASSDATAFEPALNAAALDARCLVVVARVAKARGFDEIAANAFAQATALLGPSSTFAERSMTADYAVAERNHSAVVEILDGYVQEDRASYELVRLAEAQALERPQRSRNIEFFERLPPAVRDQTDIARPWTSVLLASGKYTKAERVLQSMVNSDPADVYSLLALTPPCQCEVEHLSRAI